ncbi:Wadjet anti-phage system protein JetD domain-containing protein [Sulfurimonas sp.]|uniref:Wadjet anti-phage system protein JetD domain-containing protein n=1 Tax=Sulfurimonas sp. TaxID=2022749 RepID=UPI002AAFFE7C|nr:Wadjet anti-phage system protein JetD domain-containing protein [Sulfurimonas sp.]
MNNLEKFYIELNKSKRVKIAFNDVLHIYNTVYPEHKNSTDKNQRILILLNILEKNKQIAFPKTKWNKRVLPHIPEYINLLGKETNKQKIDLLKQNSWVPKLYFAVKINNLEQLKTLEKINEFYISRNYEELLVIPIRERSMEIFNDEKKLDSLHKKSLLFDGKLTLKDLKCEDIAPPLYYEVMPDCIGKPALICENSNSFHSFNRWNKQSEVYGAIIYGNGNEFRKTHHWLNEIQKNYQISKFFYFGDIDPIGLEIPYYVNRDRVNEKMTSIFPAKKLYLALLKSQKSNIISKKNANKNITNDIFNWLESTEMIEVIKKLFVNKLRIPQEAISYEDLSQFSFYDPIK